MGFLGSIRKIKLSNFKNGAYEVEKLSDDLVRNARKAASNDIANFFTTKYLRLADGVPMLGKGTLSDFSRFAREGDFVRSFQRAFPGNVVFNNPSVKNALNRLLLEARRTLPDFRYTRNIERMEEAGVAFKIDAKKLDTIEKTKAAVESNSRLKSAYTRLVRFAANNKKLLLFGAVVGVSGVTAETLYQELEKIAISESCCFAYYTDASGAVQKCKVKSYSCKSAHLDGPSCLRGGLPASILENQDCQLPENREKVCIHCNDDDPVNVDLPEQVILRCEEKTVGQVLLEAITNTLGDVWTGVSGGLRNIFIYGAIFLVIIVVLVIVINFLR